ncbi:hypothetical protein BJN34_05325 [Cupriavidus necator]|uniref:YXWGXW repeat-containing protein n=1 Tax=Cupriavidus necator TaxID=106590 RepID=A0A1U9UKS6_CUPNE|nr:hypothetical protein [Cupriavidus necator]AQV93314.1 hypothetical protein BJN34_05325 [Cupriavidus necator]
MPSTTRPTQRPLPQLWKPALVALVAACSLTGCVTERVVVREPAPQRQVVRAMPAPVHEDRGTAPGYGWNWVPGHWRWAGNDWLWVHGKWLQQPVPPMPPVIVEQITVAPAPHAYWVPGHWVWRYDAGGGWMWVRGGWH